MVRDLGLRRALRMLDRLPAGPALAAGLGVGAALGFVCLRDPSAAGIAGFVALVAAAAPLALSARPVAMPAGDGARATVGDRLKAALSSRATLPSLVLAGLVGVVVWRGSRARSAPDIPLMPAPPETATTTARDRDEAPAASSVGGPAPSATATPKGTVSPAASSPRQPKASAPQPPRPVSTEPPPDPSRSAKPALPVLLRRRPAK
ncbi:hypothetical protein WME94_05140 [Sorangium sp. So ce429]